MIKKLTYILILLIFASTASFAEKIPVKIAPTKMISTHHDEIELGDNIPFEIVNDVYIDDKIYLKKGTIVLGTVDFVHPNGWAGDNAEIWFKSFSVKQPNCKNFDIDYSLKIKGNSERANNIKQALAYYVIRLVRGSEIFIEPDSKIYNIFIEH